jgi:hypothetical protein
MENNLDLQKHLLTENQALAEVGDESEMTVQKFSFNDLTKTTSP